MAGIPVSEEDLKLASMVFRENIQYAAGLMHKVKATVSFHTNAVLERAKNREFLTISQRRR